MHAHLKLSIAIVVSLSANMANAKPVTITCEMIPFHEVIAKKFVIAFDENEKLVELLEPKENPSKRKSKLIKKINKPSILVFHQDGIVNKSGQKANFQHRAEYDPTTGDIVINSKPIGYSNGLVSYGKCRES